MRSPRALILILLAILCLPALPAAATSYVPMTDEALVDQAPVAVVAVIGSAGPASQDGRPFTEYAARVERVLKGAVSSRDITVSVPGGVRPDGIGLRIWGAPRFAADERVLLLLSPRPEGNYGIFQLMLGAFHEVRSGGKRLAVRDLSEARPVVPHGGTAPAETARDFDLFSSWAQARGQGRPVRSDYAVEGDPRLPRSLTDRFTFFSINGLNLRWFDFDSGNSVSFSAHQDGQQGVAGGGFAEFQTALAAWNADPGTNISYTYAGTTTATGGLNSFDGINTILFNQDIGSPFSCDSGGVLALGGPWFSSTPQSYNGLDYLPIAGADIETNEGIACFFQNSVNASQAAAELFAHELGHTLGLGHSEDKDALMFPFIHNDGRGAQLGSDDRAGIAVLYGPTVDSGPRSFYTLTPCRLLDTRDSGGALASGELRTVSALGQCGIPTSATAIVANVTAVSPTRGGYLTLFPNSLSVPSTSTLNFNAGNTRANLAVVLLSDPMTQTFTILSGAAAGGAVHVIVDVSGYFMPTDVLSLSVRSRDPKARSRP